MTFRLALFVIYRNPKDYPGRFVVREQRVGPGTRWVAEKPTAVVGTLDEARAAVPPGLTNLGRYESDDPVIAEVWI